MYHFFSCLNENLTRSTIWLRSVRRNLVTFVMATSSYTRRRVVMTVGIVTSSVMQLVRIFREYPRKLSSNVTAASIKAPHIHTISQKSKLIPCSSIQLITQLQLRERCTELIVKALTSVKPDHIIKTRQVDLQVRKPTRKFLGKLTPTKNDKGSQTLLSTVPSPIVFVTEVT